MASSGDENAKSRNLVWIDLEMTGLDPRKDTVLEIATIVTDGQLEVLAEGPVDAIHHSDDVLQSMDPWCVDMHGKTGLTERCRKSTTTMAEAEERALAFIQKWCLEKKAPLCGNSIFQDKRFLIKYMPRLSDYLHYRLVDVSTIKELVKRWYPEHAYESPNEKQHQALEDIRESIRELKYYREKVFKASS